MDIFLLIGIITGLLTLIVGMILKGANVAVLLNPAAIVIIFVGTTAAVINSFPKSELSKIGKVAGVLFKDKKNMNAADIVIQLVDMSQIARREGLLALENMTEKMDNPFMKKGLEMAVDGLEQEYIREVLNIEIENMEERHRLGASIFTTAGGAAPTLGVMGAVVGLIAALGNLDDVEALGHMIAGAFVATLFGIFVGYVMCHPFATRLKRKSFAEIRVMYIIVEGILSIQAGENPKSIVIKLEGMLSPEERAELSRKQNSGKNSEGESKDG